MSNHLKAPAPTIEAIRGWEFVGNAHSDGPTFAAVTGFVLDESQPIAHRAEALWIMGNRGMGLTVKEFDPELPECYVPGTHADLDAATVQRFMNEVAEAKRGA